MFQKLYKSLRIDNKSAHSWNKGCKSSSNPELALFSFLPYPAIVLTLGMVVAAATTAFGLNQKAALAQTLIPKSTSAGVKSISQVQALFVNPNMGDDTTGNGKQESPLRTITRALEIAQGNTTIVLSKGTYSTETGEQFPLILKPGISIQGDPRSQGRRITIQGGGDYLSRFFGSKNATIIAANQSALTGVTITNSNPRGYGLWIESGNPQVAENTFIGSTQDGVAVTGKAAPIIQKNKFYRNGANGITISGSAKPEIRENVLQQTGFGISVAENAQPLIVGNSIQYNRSGIIVQANSRPVLRHNLIQGNKEDGLVAIYQAMPDLGNATEPGGNKFANNGRYHINASAAKQTISAYGNNVGGSDRIAGQVNFSGSRKSLPTMSPLSNNPTSTRRLLSLPDRNRLTNNNNSPSKFTHQLPNIPKKTQSVGQRARASQKIATSNSPFPKPRNLTSRQKPNSAPSNLSNDRQLNYVRIAPNTIEFAAPKLPNPSVATPTRQVRQQNSPGLDKTPGNTVLLPVPGANIPGMDNGNIINSRNSNYTRNLAAANTNNSQFASRYRVMAQIQTQRDQELVRFLAPDAFPTIWRGQAYMQAGVFSSPYNARNMQQILNNNGLRAFVQPLN
ncbi:DUF1565 domain-containing protein [Calothrix rhizosoleniae]|uniref:DUF1565 domain-containing protein n=1 Tax=Calothrix rhizosoleniae TaxID=888997 RepID=UPI001F3ACADF|nr:DUF1565 domain-containing protein [Calothrix rhizosoleniae]